MMNSSINIIFSTSSELNHGYISGTLVNIDSNNIYEIGLFEYPPLDPIREENIFNMEVFTRNYRIKNPYSIIFYPVYIN